MKNKKNRKKNNNYKKSTLNLNVFESLLKVMPTPIAHQSLITMLLSLFDILGLDTPFMNDVDSVAYMLACDDYKLFEEYNTKKHGKEWYSCTIKSCEDCFDTLLLNEQGFVEQYKGSTYEFKRETFLGLLLYLMRGWSLAPEEFVGKLNGMAASSDRQTATKALFILTGFAVIEQLEKCA